MTLFFSVVSKSIPSSMVMTSLATWTFVSFLGEGDDLV
jgi:hypothetical protein